MMITTNSSLVIDGILLLNKPEGMTSNGALQRVKRLFGVKKAGHSGSLDPLATGMLPICFGEATKVCQFLLDADKCYKTTGVLGIKTDTSDSTGRVISLKKEFSIHERDVIQTLARYTGEIEQIPSMYSALKHNGVPLYRYARQGLEIVRSARKVVISQLILNGYDGHEFSLSVSCSKGTYIRNLVEDIGDALGVGAHVKQLHRVYTSGFQDSSMYTLTELEKMTLEQKIGCLIPMDKAIDNLTSVLLSDNEVMSLRQGRKVLVETNGFEGDLLRLYNLKSEFIGIGERLACSEVKAKRLLSFKL